MKEKTTEQETKENVFGLFDYKKEKQTKRKSFWVFTGGSRQASGARRGDHCT